MIRWLTSRAPADDSPWRWLLHPDPEQLVPLARALAGDGPAADESAARFSRVVSSIRVGAIHKLTSPGRLRECDEVLADALRARGAAEVRFLDVGASDGATTVDTVRALRERLGVPIRGTMIDRYTRLLRYGAGPLAEYRSPDGSPVMVRLGPLGLQLSSVAETRDPVSRLLGGWYLRGQARRARLPLAATLDLVSPAVRRAGIEVVEANLLEPRPAWRGRFDAIRASNVLNLGYFTEPELDVALRHIHADLAAGGILLISRNHLDEGGAERGSAWRRSEDGFARLRDFGGGSYVAALVDAWRAPAPA